MSIVGAYHKEELAAAHAARDASLEHYKSGPAKWCVRHKQVVVTLVRAEQPQRPKRRAIHHDVHRQSRRKRGAILA